jgi:hypothetical protein
MSFDDRHTSHVTRHALTVLPKVRRAPLIWSSQQLSSKTNRWTLSQASLKYNAAANSHLVHLHPVSMSPSVLPLVLPPMHHTQQIYFYLRSPTETKTSSSGIFYPPRTTLFPWVEAAEITSPFARIRERRGPRQKERPFSLTVTRDCRSHVGRHVHKNVARFSCAQADSFLCLYGS